MEQDDLDQLIRQRIRALRLARGWSLDTLARKSHLSPSNLSRIETGGRRIAVDQLVHLARALGTTLDQLVEPLEDEDVVIRPDPTERDGLTVWTLTPERTPFQMRVAKMRLTKPAPAPEELGVHPGRDWFLVLTGTVELRLGERLIIVGKGNAAEFSTMIPHGFGARSKTAEILTILTPDGERAHMPQSG
jgi:transcriptional regulator with XRE-family HTH domain